MPSNITFMVIIGAFGTFHERVFSTPVRSRSVSWAIAPKGPTRSSYRISVIRSTKSRPDLRAARKEGLSVRELPVLLLTS